MPVRQCQVCGALVAPADWRSHQLAHRERKGSGRTWRRIRAQVISRDHGRCSNCGSREKLEVHHRDGDWRNNAMSNLVTLCDECHDRA